MIHTRNKDLSGQRFNKLLVNCFSHSGIDGRYWNCTCDCGNKKKIATKFLMGGIKSCGCAVHNSPPNKTHGLSRSKEYNIWQSMKNRCYRKNVKEYKYYGARGIAVCKRWHKFEYFYKDMGKKPEGRSLDRINNNGNYEPKNCRWSTRHEQSSNTVRNVIISHHGKTKTVAEWERYLGLKRGVIHNRLRKLKWNTEKALTNS